ncbi:MAG: cytidylate kinase [Rhodospirillaceae bacterium]|nr:cytidylate kinase [Rhodospirillaceae bacterium]|tara:strand:- start:1325 stop:1963 length:639 start_codon:yes stop_codon:yes gene_type:complete
MIIAVDGSAASGKGTLAKRLARHFNLAHLDTGGLYRLLALHLIRSGINAETADEQSAAEQIAGLDLDLINTPAIRDDSVAGLASVIAAMPTVRAAFLVLQRSFASHPPTGNGAVLDGRDIGSVVLPNAPFKFFVDADIKVRAERRTNELQAAGQSVMFRSVLADMQARDARDRGRSIAPLRAVEDAKLIDTSSLDADQVFAFALAHIDVAGT